MYSWEWPFLLDLRTIEEGISNAGLRNRGFDQQDRRLNQIHQGEVGFEQENGDWTNAQNWDTHILAAVTQRVGKFDPWSRIRAICFGTSQNSEPGHVCSSHPILRNPMSIQKSTWTSKIGHHGRECSHFNLPDPSIKPYWWFSFQPPIHPHRQS